jgi:hypothetical protein
MSTRIYDAFKINDGKLETVFAIKRGLEPRYERHVLKTLNRVGDDFLVRDLKFIQATPAVERLLDKRIKRIPIGDLLEVIDLVMARNLKEPLNFSTSMVLFYHKDNIYIQFFGVDFDTGREYISDLEKKDIISDFHYQNQTDAPYDISEKDFKARGEVWNGIYKLPSDTPVRVSFSYDFWSRGFQILHKFFQEQG